MTIDYSSPNTPTRPQPAEHGVFSDGVRMLVMNGGVGPDRCFKCNAPTRGRRRVYKVSRASWLAFLLLGGMVALAARRNARVTLGVCRTHRLIEILISFALLVLLLAGGGILIVAMFMGTIISVQMQHNVTPWIWLGLASVVAGIVLALLAGAPLRAKRIEDEIAWVDGACAEFMDSLPRGRVE